MPDAEAGGARAPVQDASVPKQLYGLFLVVFLEMWGAAMTVPVFQYFCMTHLGLTATYVGVIMASFNFAQLLGAPAVGRVSDAVGRRPALLGCFVWTAACFFVTAGVSTFVEMLVVRTVAGLSGGSIPITQAMVMDATAPASRPAVLGVMGGLLGLAFTIGPAVSVFAMAVANFSRRWVFVVAAVFALAGCVVGGYVLQETLPEDKRRPLSSKSSTAVAEDEQGVCGSLLSGPRALAWEIRGVWSPAMACIWVGRFCSSFAFLCLFSTYAFLIRDTFGWGDMQYGMILACSGVTAAGVQFLLYPRASKSLGKHAVFSLGSVCIAMYFVLLPYTTIVHPNVPLHVAIKLLFCTGSAFMDAGIPDLVGFHAPEDRMGFAQGLVTAFRSMASVAAPLVAGRAYDESPQTVYLLAASIAFVGGISVA